MNTSLSEACRRPIDFGSGMKGSFFSLSALAERGYKGINRLPVSLRIVLEALLRNCDGQRVADEHVIELAGWKPRASRSTEIPFCVGRIILQDPAGIPVLGDLAAMRGAAARAGVDASVVDPQVPVDMVVDHAIAVDFHATPDAAARNMKIEFERNDERFRFSKWAMQAFNGVRVVPPGFGILHQVNLEYFGRCLLEKGGVYFPDTLVGTDSHSGMIAGLGIVGFGVGGIEASAAMLGQPVSFLTPDVVGVHVTGALSPGVTATDLVLHVTDMLRKAKVVGKFVEFFGEGVASLTVPDRATVANMAPEYGATIGYFPFDEQSRRYLLDTGRPEKEVAAAEAYYRTQGCFGSPKPGDIDYSQVLELNLASITPNVAGPKRPQDRIALGDLKQRFGEVLLKTTADGGYNKQAAAVCRRTGPDAPASDGDVLIAAITSCTNTSNPGVMLAAGLLARKALARGLKPKSWVKTSLAPGSIVVSKYLEAAGLQRDLDQLGYGVVGYGCTTCVGNSGPIDAAIEKAVNERDVVGCAVLSGNRNFEARIHASVRAAFLMSPPLVVAFALAGTIDIDLTREPLGRGKSGEDVYLRDIWPTQEELAQVLAQATNPGHYVAAYQVDFARANPLWAALPAATGAMYAWDAKSTYFKEPPFFSQADLLESGLQSFKGGRALAVFGNSITTDHISPISNVRKGTPAGQYLAGFGVAEPDFNNYGTRRMNHEVMVRGTFANPRLRNQMVPGIEGGVTAHQPDGERMSIYDASVRYAQDKVPLFVIAGEDYGSGSARDWAAKGSRLLGIRAVIAKSFERIHRSNLVGMGVLPCEFPANVDATSLKLDGTEVFDLLGVDEKATPRQAVTLVIHRKDGSEERVSLTLRLDTRAEITYVRNGGILPYVFRSLTSAKR